MLELKKVTKIYKTGDLKQTALNDVSVNFRENEFAAILGPSGSGKTTLLNIIGGLDNYTSGDLIINGISTKKYKDSDWDSYRNHRIGFVFQSYNLISHQTVLQNVMLALTLSGISKKEGAKRAKKVLKEVGLEDHINKRPNQLSGGQMQRVAIARALVNNPDILLADEPTGALDSETSVQIMNLLKKISKDKLVIMVTHNPELAEEYATRIINLKDGKITSDTNEFDGVNKKSTKDSNNAKSKKTSMSFFTALGLSFNNLMTKKGRTILVSFAGSIGIIGIALILSLSTGFQNYIDKLQEDTLTSYPLTITSESADMTSMLLSMVGGETEETEGDTVKEKQFISSMFSNITTNDLRSFKRHIEKNNKLLKKDVSSIKYSYSIDPLIYTKDLNGKLSKVNPNSLFSSMYTSGISNLYSSYSSIFSQMTDDRKSLEEQYELLEGSWPNKYDEMVLVLSEKNAIPDMLLYFLGFRDMEELSDIISKTLSGDSIEVNNDPMEFTYKDLMNVDLRLINSFEIYKYNKKYDIYEDMSDDDSYLENLYSKGLKIKISGVVCAKDGTSSMALTPGIAYTSDLIDYIIDTSSKSEIVKKQLSNEDIDVFSNTRFDSKKQKKNMDFEDMITIDKDMLKSAFNINLDETKIKSMTSGYMQEISEAITTDITPAKKAFTKGLSNLVNGIFDYYISTTDNKIDNPMKPGEKLTLIYSKDVDSIVNKYLSKSSSKKIMSDLEKNYVIPSDVYKTTYKSLLSGLLNAYIGGYYSIDKSLTKDEDNLTAAIIESSIDTTISTFMSDASIIGAEETMAAKMTEAKMQKNILSKVGELTEKLMSSIASAFKVDNDKIAAAFKFNLSEDELKRIITAMMSGEEKGTMASNLATLGYQDKEEPTMISIYFSSFDGKERFLDFIDKYNDDMKKTNQEDKVINYTDTTGILMSSVKKIVNSVSYVLIAFVSISLIVSSIMIGIITYISVLERTKEIGILRAIGASKRNISTIFNAETFIIGLLSGFIGIGITYALIPIINRVIHSLTNNMSLSAVLPIASALLLVVLSVILTLIGGLIPSKKASKQDPVVALRSE